MAKAVTEVGIGAAAIGAAVLMPGIGAGLVWMTASMQSGIIGGLIGIGSSSIMAGIADALKGSQGGLAVGVTTPIGPWAYIYGTQKVGGVEIFRQSNSSQGTSNDKQLHRVYALACHPCVGDQGYFQLRIDGKQVLLRSVDGGVGWQSYSPTQISSSITSMTRDANGLVTVHLETGINGLDGTSISIQGAPDNTLNGIWIVSQPSPVDNTLLTFVSGGTPGTVTGGTLWTLFSDYQDKIYVEFLNGNHTSTFKGLLASGTSWSASDLCLGHTLVYVRMGWDAGVFPSSIPNVSFVIQGKNEILDPRTGMRGYTNNAALCIADFMSLPPMRGGFGMQIGTDIPAEGLIAAANICDEPVDLAAGGTIPRYECDTFFQLNAGRGSILKNMLTSCMGRLSFQGGQYSIFPAAAVAPTLQLTDADIIGTFTWKPRLSIRETCNAVKGTYVSPENAYQQGDFPAYMQDAAHGYAADSWLAEDQGERIFMETNFPCTVRSATAQRLAKIALLRTRYQMRGTARFTMKAYQAVALDVVQITHPRYGWVNKSFEVLSSRFVWEKSGDVPVIAVELDLAETDTSIYDWSITEELTPQGYAQPSNVGNSVCTPPEQVSAYSGPGETVNGVTYPSTISTTASGIAVNSIYVRWIQPNDANVVNGGHLEVQWQALGASAWNALANIAPSASSCFINGVTDGAQYNVQVRAVNCAGVPSAWVLAGPITVSSSLSSIAYSGVPVAPDGTLSAQGFSDGTAQILCLAFTARVGASSAVCTPTPNVVTGLNQSQVYYVYYIDLTFSGGNIALLATQNPADFENRTAYFLIGSIITPSYTPRYQPSAYSDHGSQGTVSPAAAYDNDVTTWAAVGARWQTYYSSGEPNPLDWLANGDCVWEGFPTISPAGATTLHCIAEAYDNSNGATWSMAIKVSFGGTLTTLASFSWAASEHDYTIAIPAGTDLSTITLEATATTDQGPMPAHGTANGSVSVSIFEVYIQ